MRAVALFFVLALAHVVAVAGREFPLSVWTLPALFWQDVAVALAFAGFVCVFRRRPFLVWGVYAALVVWAAINVPVARVLSSPLTPAMLRAARGTLRDSIAYYASPIHVGSILLVACAGVSAIWLSRIRLSRRTAVGLVILSTLTIAVGPFATSRVAAPGWHRNAFGAMWPVRAPEARAGDPGLDWRLSPIGAEPARDDLSGLRRAAAGRHVILVLLESTGAAYLAPWGFDRDPMPRLTDLSAHGVLFETAYAVYPESIRGLLPVLCSAYPAFGVPASDYEDFRCPSIASELARRGYRTGLFHSGRFAYLGMRAIVEDRGFEVLEDAGNISGNFNSSFGVDEPATLGRVFDWIDSLEPEERFFLTYLPIAGHHPYATPEPGSFAADSEFGRYLNALEYGDGALGALLDGLKERGLYDDTLLVIFGDHGEAFGGHEGNFGHSFFIYDTNVRVPYLVAIPGITDDGVRVRDAISVVDTAPTILDLLGLPAPPEYQGASALSPEPRMALFYTDYALGWLGLYDDCRKYIFNIDSGRSELYDVCLDPGETRNLAPAEPQQVRAYRERVEAWAAAQILRFDEP